MEDDDSRECMEMLRM